MEEINVNSNVKHTAGEQPKGGIIQAKDDILAGGNVLIEPISEEDEEGGASQINAHRNYKHKRQSMGNTIARTSDQKLEKIAALVSQDYDLPFSPGYLNSGTLSGENVNFQVKGVEHVVVCQSASPTESSPNESTQHNETSTLEEVEHYKTTSGPTQNAACFFWQIENKHILEVDDEENEPEKDDADPKLMDAGDSFDDCEEEYDSDPSFSEDPLDEDDTYTVSSDINGPGEEVAFGALSNACWVQFLPAASESKQSV